MNNLDLLQLSGNSLWRRKVRTILTTLGVIIGTTSIVVMLSLGIGLNEMQRENMERWGSLTMIRVQQGMIFDAEGNPLKEGKQLNDEAVDELRSIDGVLAVSPVYNFGGEASYGRKRGGLNLIGLDASSMNQLEFTAEQGRLLEEGDRNVMVIGREVINNFRDEAFIRQMRKGMGMEGMMSQEEQDPGELLNQRISMTINARENKRIFGFTVVGILEGERTEHSYQAYIPIDDLKRMRDFGSNGNSRSSNMVIMEGVAHSRVSTASSKRSATQQNSDDYDYILVRTNNVEQSQKASQVIKDLGYNTWSMADQLEGIEKTSRTIQAILGGIGSITLLVAALGITNTMIMSIYERTREIGIMKVIGASFHDIYKMFLTEAGLIGFLGGIFGLCFSYIVSYIINRLSAGFMNQGMVGGEASSISVIPVWLTLFAVLFSILVGLLAGIYPAYRAVRLSPINAIRNE
ncbi:MAG: ABC transporter permease [Firmicutes bacterium HGW-Firmicutes-12]|jgi:ABC-type antimicrobial peptide transport system permease subunit|nr:MAG: ABC transporter permease [Firmicutes bacterium HGW-Firmicutes-12]